MKLSIIPSDGAVCKDDLCYINLTWEGTPIDVHALQWFDVTGWIEFIDESKPNENITQLPEWANNAMASWQIAYNEAHNPPPPPSPPTAEQNKQKATNLLSATDWTTIADVSDPTKSNPYLANVNEFLSYRNEVRQYAVYPVAGYITFPIVPQEVWVKI